MYTKLKGFAFGFVLGACVVFLFMFLVGIVLWFAPTSQPCLNHCVGFGKIKCLEPSIKFSSTEDKLSVAFINGAGTEINIIGVNASSDCTVNDVNAFNKTVLEAGEVMRFSCRGDNLADKQIGEPFTVTLQITYIQKIAGMAVTHREEGIIQGCAE